MSILPRQFSFDSAVRIGIASACLMCIISMCYPKAIFENHPALMRQAPASLDMNSTASINKTYFNYNTRLVQALLSNDSAMLPLSYDDNNSWKMMLPNIYAYSAYIEPDNAVKIISLAPISGKIPRKVRCLVRGGNSTISVTPRLIPLETPFNFTLRAATILCQLKRTEPNLQVTLTTDPAPKNLSWINISSAVLGRRAEFSMCYQPLKGRRIHLIQLAEFLSYYALLGVTRFTFYLHEASRAEEQFLLRLRARGSVTIVLLPWTTVPDDVRRVAEAAALHDCLHRNRFQAEYVVYADLDEHIVLKNARTLREALKNLTQDPSVSSFIIAHKPFCIEYCSEAPRSELHPPLFARVYKEGHFRLWPHGYRSKWIAKPKDVIVAYVHYIPLHVKGKRSVHVHKSRMVLYHYRQCVDLDPLSIRGVTYSGKDALRGRRERENLVESYVDDILNSDTFIFVRSLLAVSTWSSGIEGEDWHGSSPPGAQTM